MTKLTINIGAADKGDGDPLRTAFSKVNDNFTELYSAIGADVQIPVQTDNGGKYLTTNGTALSWATVATPTTSSLVNGSHTVNLSSAGLTAFPAISNESLFIQGAELGSANASVGMSAKNSVIVTANILDTAKQWTFSSTGALEYPNGALQRDTGSITCPGNASTLVYTTSSASNQHTMKLLIQVEGFVGANVDFDTQACEMIIAKSFRADAIAASVYGVVHTSVAPLATFTADWNPLTSKVEVLCTTPSVNSVDVKIFATEITTSD